MRASKRAKNGRITRAHCGMAVALLLVLGLPLCGSAADDLVVGRLTLVEASATVPYAYWYYVPESVARWPRGGARLARHAGRNQPERQRLLGEVRSSPIPRMPPGVGEAAD